MTFGDSVNEKFSVFARVVEGVCGSPWAFAAAFFSVVIWLACGPVFHWSDTYQLVINTATTIVTFLMVFLIQSTQTRDTKALQAKLDELIRVNSRSRNSFIQAEDLNQEQLEELRKGLLLHD